MQSYRFAATTRKASGLNILNVSLALLMLVILISLQLIPTVDGQGRDSGIFAYTGKVILEGGLPYVDAWDNKLPGVYYIDALAFALFGVNRWSLWVIEAIFLTLTGVVMFWLVARVYRRRDLAWWGAVAVVALSRHPALVSDVNFTEPFALLPQMIVFAAGYQFARQPSHRMAFLIGFSAGCAFLIKQTTVGVALSFIPALIVSRHPIARVPERWAWFATIVVGGLSCLGGVALYLLANGILDDAVNASFVSARAFHGWVTGDNVWIWETIWQSLTRSVFPLVFGPLLPFLIIGGRLAIRRVRMVDYHSERAMMVSLLGIWALLTFPVDLALANITYRAYEHYYVPLIPSAVLLIVASLPALSQRATRGGLRVWRRARLARHYLVWLLILVPILSTVLRFWLSQWNVTGPEKIDPVAVYVSEHTQPEDLVFVWGANTLVNFQSERDSPTQYTYGYALVVPEEEALQEEQVKSEALSQEPEVTGAEEAIRELVADLLANPPVMIVDSAFTDGDRIPPLDAHRRAEWWALGGRRDTADLTPIYQLVASYCVPQDQFEQAMIYRCDWDRVGIGGTLPATADELWSIDHELAP